MIHIPWIWSINETFASDLAMVPQVVTRVLNALERHQWSDADRFGVHLSLEEALVNAIKHGNKSDPNKSVHVRVQLADDRIQMEIADEGPGFDPNQVPDPTDESHLEIPSGRGLLLMRNYMSSIDFNDVGNRVTMEKRRSQFN